MKKLKSLPYIVLAAFFLFSSCDTIHEFPETGKEVDPSEINVRLKIDCLPQISEYTIVSKNGDAASRLPELESVYDRRYIVSIRSNEYSDEPVQNMVVTREASDLSELLIDTKLHARKYKLAVWMDYVQKGTENDLYYLTSDGKAINAVHQPAAAEYVAGSDFKDAQTFTSDLDLTSLSGQWFADFSITAPLARPMAKITVLANDLADYAASIGYVGSLSRLAEELTIDFSYDGYYPTGFNAHTGKLNDSQTGYGFKFDASYPYALEKRDYTRIGSDYVLIQDESSSVTVSAKVSSKSGKLINEVDNMVIPIYKGKETVLIFKFLTKEYIPGIGIDPGFDGEFYVVIR